MSFAEDTGHLLLVPCQHLSTFIFCFSAARWTPKLSRSNISFSLHFNQAMYNKPDECVTLQIKNAWSMCLKYHKHCAIDQPSKKSSTWHMKHKSPNDMTSCTFSTTANLPHSSESYASAHCTSVCAAIIILGVFPNKNSMYRSLLKSMAEYKSKHFFFFQTVWNIIYMRLIWFIQRCR